MLNRLVEKFYVFLLLLPVSLFIRRAKVYKYMHSNCYALLQFFAFFSLAIDSLTIYVCEKDVKLCFASLSYRQRVKRFSPIAYSKHKLFQLEIMPNQ